MTEQLETALERPTSFRFGDASPITRPRTLPASDPSLGPLADFTGTYTGSGFNTIFRPQNAVTPTPLPVPIPGDNVLELNLTTETLSFSKSLGTVPNRGLLQPDAFLNGVPYLQTIQDVTVPAQPVGIHFEPGLWIIVPPTTVPAEGQTVARMASIPHGTTVLAQGTTFTFAGRPTIAPVDITPFETSSPGTKFRFPSQTATNNPTARIPQDLTPFIAAGTITQAMLDDPNVVLRNAIASQNIISTTVIVISTDPAAPLFGGGDEDIAFLLGDPAASNPNADAVKMTAVFWIEIVEHLIVIPPWRPGQPPLIVPARSGEAGQPVPRFVVEPPIEIPVPRPITVRTAQIQYSQQVFLNFNGLTWPHVSVATLVQNDPVPVPASTWAAIIGGPGEPGGGGRAPGTIGAPFRDPREGRADLLRPGVSTSFGPGPLAGVRNAPETADSTSSS